MSRRTYTEISCDGCGETERREQAEPFTPNAWRIVKLGYMGADGFVPERTALLCPACLIPVRDAMVIAAEVVPG